MSVERAEEFIAHDPPGRADFLIVAEITATNFPGRKEQLWVKQIDSRSFIVRSLPWFVDIRPDDEVETDDNLVVTRTVRRSGKRLLRIAILGDRADRISSELHSLLERLTMSHEFYAAGYVAVEIVDAVPTDLKKFLDDEVTTADIFYEMI